MSFLCRSSCRHLYSSQALFVRCTVASFAPKHVSFYLICISSRLQGCFNTSLSPVLEYSALLEYFLDTNCQSTRFVNESMLVLVPDVEVDQGKSADLRIVLF